MVVPINPVAPRVVDPGVGVEAVVVVAKRAPVGTVMKWVTYPLNAHTQSVKVEGVGVGVAVEAVEAVAAVEAVVVGVVPGVAPVPHPIPCRMGYL